MNGALCLIFNFLQILTLIAFNNALHTIPNGNQAAKLLLCVWMARCSYAHTYIYLPGHTYTHTQEPTKLI